MEKISFWKVKNKGSEKKNNSDMIKSIEKSKNNSKQDKKYVQNSLEKRSDDGEHILSLTERQDKLTRYCSYLESIIDESQLFLNKAYEDSRENNLEERLRRNVLELICLQREMKNLVDNIKALKTQISSVRLNIKEQKAKIKSLKNEENKTRFSFIAEKSNQNYKNSIKFSRETLTKNRAQISPSTIVPEVNAVSTLKNSRQTNLTRSTNASTSTNLARQHFRKNSSSKNNDRAFFVPPANKNSKMARQSYHRGSLDGRKPGITVYLHPINEADILENEDDNIPSLGQSHPVTPNPSIINFPWLNISTPSDTTTHPESLPSDAYSLSNED